MSYTWLPVSLYHLSGDRFDADSRRADVIASAAKKTRDMPPSGSVGSQFMMDAPSGSKRFRTHGIVSTGFSHETIQQTGVPDSQAIDLIFGLPVKHIKTGTRRTTEIARGAGDATPGDVLPEFFRNFLGNEKVRCLLDGLLIGILKQIRLRLHLGKRAGFRPGFHGIGNRHAR